jgi:hypothetical protein
MCKTLWLGNLKGRDHSENLDVDGMIILKSILGKEGGGCGLDSSGSVQGWVVGSCEHSNEPSSSIKGKGFLI